MLDGYLSLGRKGFEVCFVEADHSHAEPTSGAVREALDHLNGYFEISASPPKVRAILAPSRDAFDDLVADVVGIQIERPSDPRRIAQPQRADIVLLSPSAYAGQSAYTYVLGDFLRMIHHELVHVYEEHLSPDIETSRLWWGEGLAVYLSGQWRHESQFEFREPVQEAIQSGQVPNLSAIQTDLSLAYAFGWTLVRYIEQSKGQTAIAHAVRCVDDGDVLTTLGEDLAIFERDWKTWLLSGKGVAV